MDHYHRSRLNHFTDASVDRVAVRRVDPGWIAERLAARNTRIVPLWRSSNLFSHAQLIPVELEPHQLGDYLAVDSLVLLGELNGYTYFAVDLPSGDAALPQRWESFGQFRDLKEVGMVLPDDIAALLAYARGIAYWHQRHRFCGECGRPTRSTDGGHMRVCTDDDCGGKQFPRTDPAVIVLVHHEDRCLLARQRDWPGRMHSVLAGFVEPGESIEETVVREVGEEAGVRVTDVEYQSSQPWPFPSSLMLGFRARALTTELVLGDDELAEARWCSRSKIVELVTAGELRLPSPVSISYRLIEDWFDAEASIRLRSLVET